MSECRALEIEIVRHFVPVRRQQNVMQQMIVLPKGPYWLKGTVDTTY